MSTTTTFAPRCARSRTVASPRPDAPPVTIAEMPLRSMGRDSIDWSVKRRKGQISPAAERPLDAGRMGRSEEHTSELQSLMRISYAVFCLKNKKNTHIHDTHP